MSCGEDDADVFRHSVIIIIIIIIILFVQ